MVAKRKAKPSTANGANGHSGPILEVKNLKTQFQTQDGTVKAVDDVSFYVMPGETLGVVGESGCGKSMTGLSIMRLIPSPPGKIVAGEILFNGDDILRMSDDQVRSIRGNDIAMIFQDPMTSLNPVLTINRQISEALQLHMGMNKAQAKERTIQLLKMVGIPNAEERVDQYPHQFSGGMRQRVVIALALAAEPRLVVADEPTTALDVSIQAQIIDLLKRLGREQGTSIILITHDMGVIAETADRVAVMYAGRIAEIGPVKHIIQTPSHPYTQGLMGSIPSLARTTDRLVQIEGNMPRLTAIPAGCAFNPRCPKRMDRCLAERPELMQAAGSQAACWLYEEQP